MVAIIEITARFACILGMLITRLGTVSASAAQGCSPSDAFNAQMANMSWYIAAWAVSSSGSIVLPPTTISSLCSPFPRYPRAQAGRQSYSVCRIESALDNTFYL